MTTMMSQPIPPLATEVLADTSEVRCRLADTLADTCRLADTLADTCRFWCSFGTGAILEPVQFWNHVRASAIRHTYAGGLGAYSLSGLMFRVGSAAQRRRDAGI